MSTLYKIFVENHETRQHGLECKHAAALSAFILTVLLYIWQSGL
ncbi:hypothetical protein AB434_0648 [Heyndrickxia coagulans]|uniref:Uncharacterized protein n=1 Tax=Heyndrickxia coagulans TaxID=1398 RepID=A0AAN0WAU7_HEYCO|nr:hypothetical protein SB48_HM08orf00797 [Heyndrickxia coagulans]AKN53053.1 hypothetical protein AB434_0648 [Heyndrickxia coagulans]